MSNTVVPEQVIQPAVRAGIVQNREAGKRDPLASV